MSILLSEDRKVFEKTMQEICCVLDINNEFPNQIFQPYLSKYIFIPFDDVFSEYFYSKISLFSSKMCESVFTFMVLNPDPDKYFFHHFRKFPLIKFDKNNTSSEYQSLISEDPGESPADAILFNSTELIFFGENRKWAIYGNRDFELAVFAGINNEVVSLFSLIYGNDKTFGPKTAIKEYLEVAWVSNGVPKDVKTKIYDNYNS